MTRATGWYDDPPQFWARLAAFDNSITKLSLGTGVPRTTLASAKGRHEAAGHLAASEDVELTVEENQDLDAMIRDRGLNPDEWLVDRVTVNTWTAADGTLARQLKAHLRRKFTLELLAAAGDVRPIAAPRKPDKTKPRLVVFVGDEQEPYSDPVLKDLFLRWLARNTPEEAVHLGDLMDFPTISRHRDNPAYNASPQECVNAGYATLRAYREASPDTAWTYLAGNHDDRIRTEQLSRAERLYGLRPADMDGEQFEQALSLKRLLHLDQLGIEYVHAGGGNYQDVEVEVSPNLVARHGWITGNNSAERTLRKLGVSCVVGHTHDQKATRIRQHRGRTSVVIEAVEAGCMCEVAGGLGYVVNPEWVQGFATATIWPDGRHLLEMATYEDGVLVWRDQRYSALAKAA